MNTLHCFKPDCQSQNSLNARFCIKCGTPFLLNERYQCVKTLGQGGFGRTHLVTDIRRSHTKVVVKQFIPGEDLRQNTSSLQKALQLFHDESQRLLQLDQHPQIPTLFEAFEAYESHFLVQQFVDGQTLTDELIQQGAAFTEEQVRTALLDLLPTIQFMHDHQIIHRDIKPDNVIRRNSDRRLVLVDFGAAKVATQTVLTNTGTQIGSPGYAAPEQIYGKATFSSDLYSLGVTCLHLLTQMDPFDLYSPLESGFNWRHYLVNQTVSDALANILDRLTANTIQLRYTTAQEVIDDLHSLQPKTQAIFTPASSKSVPSPSISFPLESEKGVDYQKLQKLLKAGFWKEADQETAHRMLEAVGQESSYSIRLDLEKIRTFPCKDLQTVDRLWAHYSQGRFGFSVQKKIWQECGIPKSFGKDWDRFCAKVGWQTPDARDYVDYANLKFNPEKSSIGEIPFFVVGGSKIQDRGIVLICDYLFSRMETCKVY